MMRQRIQGLWRSRGGLAVFALVACWWGLFGAAWANAAAPALAQAATEPRTFGSSGDPAVDARAQSLGRKLRCPVCQGMPINESPATMAIDMMQQVRKMLRQGQSDDDILSYFTSRYGQWVLLEPPHDGFAMWIWIMPPLCCAGLLLLAWRIVTRLQLPRGQSDAPMAAGASQAQHSAHNNQAAATTQTDDDEAQALLAAIRCEVD